MAEKKRKKRKHFSKLMQKKLVGSFALVLFVLLGLNLRIVYITAKNGDNYAKQVLSQKQYDSGYDQPVKTFGATGKAAVDASVVEKKTN